MASSESSPLMKLPGEIRNRIYRFSVANDDVPVTRTGMTEPGLLLACKAVSKLLDSRSLRCDGIADPAVSCSDPQRSRGSFLH